MVGVALLLPLLAAAPQPVKLASPGLSLVNVDEKEGALFSEYFARQLEANGIPVTTAAEISAVIGLERQKQLLGCAEEATSCMAELAGALGVDGVITGTLGKVGTGFTLNLKIVSAQDASSMAAYSERLKNEDAVFEWLEATAKDVAQKLAPKPPVEAEKTVTLRERAWIPAALGGGLATAGIVSFTQAAEVHRRILGAAPDAYPDQAALNQEISTGKTFDAAGVALVSVGAAVLVGAGLMFALGGGDAAPDVSATVSASPAGAAVIFGGRF